MRAPCLAASRVPLPTFPPSDAKLCVHTDGAALTPLADAIRASVSAGLTSLRVSLSGTEHAAGDDATYAGFAASLLDGLTRPAAAHPVHRARLASFSLVALQGAALEGGGGLGDHACAAAASALPQLHRLRALRLCGLGATRRGATVLSRAVARRAAPPPLLDGDPRAHQAPPPARLALLDVRDNDLGSRGAGALRAACGATTRLAFSCAGPASESEGGGGDSDDPDFEPASSDSDWSDASDSGSSQYEDGSDMEF